MCLVTTSVVGGAVTTILAFFAAAGVVGAKMLNANARDIESTLAYLMGTPKSSPRIGRAAQLGGTRQERIKISLNRAPAHRRRAPASMNRAHGSANASSAELLRHGSLQPSPTFHRAGAQPSAGLRGRGFQ